MSQSVGALFVWVSHLYMAPHSNFFSFRAIALLPTPHTPVFYLGSSTATPGLRRLGVGSSSGAGGRPFRPAAPALDRPNHLSTCLLGPDCDENTSLEIRST